jgi:hypothetical protein
MKEIIEKIDKVVGLITMALGEDNEIPMEITDVLGLLVTVKEELGKVETVCSKDEKDRQRLAENITMLEIQIDNYRALESEVKEEVRKKAVWLKDSVVESKLENCTVTQLIEIKKTVGDEFDRKYKESCQIKLPPTVGKIDEQKYQA